MNANGPVSYSTGLSWWAILLIVFAGLVLLILVILGILYKRGQNAMVNKNIMYPQGQDSETRKAERDEGRQIQIETTNDLDVDLQAMPLIGMEELQSKLRKSPKAIKGNINNTQISSNSPLLATE